MDWESRYQSVACTAGQYNFTVEKQVLSKLVIGLRSTGGPPVTPTAAQLKATWLNVDLVSGGKRVPVVDASLYDLAMLTDLKNGYGRDWSEIDLSDTNIIHPFGVDLRQEGVLECKLNIPATINNCSFSIYGINDGTMPATLRYRTLATSGEANYAKARAVFCRDETGTTIDLKVGENFQKSMDYLLAKILFADMAKIEQETIFGCLMSETFGQKAKFTATGGAVTLFSIEELG